MSECVVRMEMPKHCGECELQIWDIWPGSFKCAKTRTDIMSHMRNRTKPNDCPILYQLPEGHGRLVDADALKELMLERKQPLVGADNSKDRYRYMQWLADFNAIKDVKTVVPAERNE